jgi:hypothetical protein
MKQVPYCESTNVRHHRTKCTYPGDMAPGICTSPIHMRPEDDSCMFLRNASTHIPQHTALEPTISQVNSRCLKRFPALQNVMHDDSHAVHPASVRAVSCTNSNPTALHTDGQEVRRVSNISWRIYSGPALTYRLSIPSISWQISDGLTWDGTRAATLRGQRLTNNLNYI